MAKPDRATVCLRCWKKKKRKNYQFCSKRCTQLAAKNAPQLLRVPKDHVMYKDGKCRLVLLMSIFIIASSVALEQLRNRSANPGILRSLALVLPAYTSLPGRRSFVHLSIHIGAYRP